ncbi:hypothetical protein BC936DRAFT_149951 [Jimgerdemannia flammicorona]|uniref:Uncharacterized protein n=1 Tax=Jimgerdemannia flammicorona TaxID=994334 RepID=A0A433CZV2_9FUNG|nr:hypothetical protein BC936DRAFT_149951 [Jimgerdemannia flammicorona]
MMRREKTGGGDESIYERYHENVSKSRREVLQRLRQRLHFKDHYVEGGKLRQSVCRQNSQPLRARGRTLRRA